MAVFFGAIGNDTSDSSTGTLIGFTGGSVVELQDNIGDVFRPQQGFDIVIARSGDDRIDLFPGDTDFPPPTGEL